MPARSRPHGHDDQDRWHHPDRTVCKQRPRTDLAAMTAELPSSCANVASAYGSRARRKHGPAAARPAAARRAPSMRGRRGRTVGGSRRQPWCHPSILDRGLADHERAGASWGLPSRRGRARGPAWRSMLAMPPTMAAPRAPAAASRAMGTSKRWPGGRSSDLGSAPRKSIRRLPLAAGTSTRPPAAAGPAPPCRAPDALRRAWQVRAAPGVGCCRRCLFFFFFFFFFFLFRARLDFR